MGFNEFFFGQQPTSQVNMAPGFRAPGFGFAKDLAGYLKGLIGQPAPSYGGQVDPGMSPTMQTLGRMTQGYSTSPAPQIMGQVAGTLGRYMNPTLGSPVDGLNRTISNPFGGASPGGRPGIMPGSNPEPTLGGGRVPLPTSGGGFGPGNGFETQSPFGSQGGGSGFAMEGFTPPGFGSLSVDLQSPQSAGGAPPMDGAFPGGPQFTSAPPLTAPAGPRFVSAPPLTAPPAGPRRSLPNERTPRPGGGSSGGRRLSTRPKPKPTRPPAVVDPAPGQDEMRNDPRFDEIRRRLGARPRGRGGRGAS